MTVGRHDLYRVVEVPCLRGRAIEWVDDSRILVTQRNVLYECERVGGPMRRAGVLPLWLWRSLAIRIRLVQRVLRSMFYNVIPVSDGSIFVTYAKEVGVFRDGAYRRLKGLVRPCRVLRGAAAVDVHGHVFFGEYLRNTERGPVRIYRHVPGSDDVDVVFTFPSRMIRHVHGIYYDAIGQCLWCLTGDLGDEAKILCTHDGFRTVSTIGSGDESWRAVSIQFDNDAVYYATDSEFVENKVFRFDRSTKRRTEIARLDGPVYYSTRWRGALFFAVTAELCPSQTGRSATLWTIHKGGLQQVVRIEKDRWPVPLLPGTFHFPLGSRAGDGLYFQAVALKDADGRCFCVVRS